MIGAGAGVGIGFLYQPGRAHAGTVQGLPLFESEKDAMLLGPSMALAGAIELTRIEDVPIYFEVSGSFVAGSSHGVTVHDLAGRDSFLLATGNPVGTIRLGTAGSSADADVIAPPAGSASVSGASLPGDNRQVSFAYNRVDASAALAGIVTSGTPSTAAAYGVVMTPDGMAIAGRGDLAGTRMQSDVRRSGWRTGLEAGLAASVDLGGDWRLVPRLSGFYRAAGDEIEHEVLFDVDEGAVLPNRMPVFGLRTLDRLTSQMIGPVVSLALVRPLAPGWSVTGGVDAGWLLTASQWRLATTGLMDGMPETPFPEQAQDAIGSSGMLRARAGISYAAANGTVFSLNGQLEHLTSVPTTARAADAPLPDGDLDLVLPVAANPIGIVGVPSWEYALSLSIARNF